MSYRSEDGKACADEGLTDVYVEGPTCIGTLRSILLLAVPSLEALDNREGDAHTRCHPRNAHGTSTHERFEALLLGDCRDALHHPCVLAGVTHFNLCHQPRLGYVERVVSQWPECTYFEIEISSARQFIDVSILSIDVCYKLQLRAGRVVLYIPRLVWTYA